MTTYHIFLEEDSNVQEDSNKAQNARKGGEDLGQPRSKDANTGELIPHPGCD